MKKAVIYFSLVLIIIFIGCRTSVIKDKPVNNDVIIAGKVLNYEDHLESYTIKIHERNLTNYNGINHVAFIEEDGSFRFKFEKYYKSDIYIIYGKMVTALVGPGDSVYVEFDANEFLDKENQNYWNVNSLKFSGDRASTNRQIKLFRALIISYELVHEFYENEKSLASNEYLRYLMDRKSKWENILDSLNQNLNLTKEFINWSTLFVDYQFGMNLLHYTWYNPHTKGKEAIDIPLNFHNALKDLSLENEDAIICSNYNWFLKEYYMAYTFRPSSLYDQLKRTKWNFKKSASFESEFRLLLKQIKTDYSGIAKEILLSRELFKLLDIYERVDVFDNIYHEYMDLIRNDLIIHLDKKYAEVKLNETGSLNNKTIYKQGAGLKYIQSDVFNKILNDNKGKVIYIDFWATWCGPCLMELPNSGNLQKEFIDMDVEFVYLCVKSKQNDWKEKVKEYNLDGSHYLITDAQFDILSQRFQISGIPHYVLIDKNGTVVNNNAHLRPNAAREKIDALLNN